MHESYCWHTASLQQHIWTLTPHRDFHDALIQHSFMRLTTIACPMQKSQKETRMDPLWWHACICSRLPQKCLLASA